MFRSFHFVAFCFVETACNLCSCLYLVALRWKTENNVYRLWVPNSSNFLRDYNWLEENKPEDIRFDLNIFIFVIVFMTRFNSVILAEDQDVLTPKAFQQLAALHHKVLVTIQGKFWIRGLSENAW